MVHQRLVLELALEISGIAKTIPRLDADKRRLLVIRTPKGYHRRLVVHRYCRFTIRIHQHGAMCLALMNLHRIVTEEIVADLYHALISLQRLLYHVVTTVDITLQHVHRFIVIKSDLTLQLSTRHIKGRMTAYLEMNLLAVCVLHMPDNVNLVTLQTIKR